MKLASIMPESLVMIGRLAEIERRKQKRRAMQLAEVERRMHNARAKRLQRLDKEENFVGYCTAKRPQKKARNKYSSEQAGTITPYLRAVSTGARGSVVCRSTQIF